MPKSRLAFLPGSAAPERWERGIWNLESGISNFKPQLTVLGSDNVVPLTTGKASGFVIIRAPPLFEAKRFLIRCNLSPVTCNL